MDATCSRSFSAAFNLKIRRFGAFPLHRLLDFEQRADRFERWRSGVLCCYSETEFRKLALATGKKVEKIEEWRFEQKKSHRRSRIQAMPREREREKGK
ncbi:hypothetical protein MRB53_010554 [Persea americana]|uniref:Uncharacterized protein n=1 Tax=Persea americana TaxID=3435 RepID=A0ACC2LT53_PERAE|nr:hypothetical protein MRB53_010554 [Persea americana]